MSKQPTLREAYDYAKETLGKIADNPEAPVLQRIHALTQLYFVHQFDTFSQARYIKQIQDLSKTAD